MWINIFIYTVQIKWDDDDDDDGDDGDDDDDDKDDMSMKKPHDFSLSVSQHLGVFSRSSNLLHDTGSVPPMTNGLALRTHWKARHSCEVGIAYPIRDCISHRIQVWYIYLHLVDFVWKM